MRTDLALRLVAGLTGRRDEDPEATRPVPLGPTVWPAGVMTRTGVIGRRLDRLGPRIVRAPARVAGHRPSRANRPRRGHVG